VTLGHLLLLSGSLVALAAGALRVGSLIAPSGLERAVTAAVLAAATATVETLLLGLVGLGASPVALTAAAAAALAVALKFTPAPDLGLGAELSRGWLGLTPRGRAAVGAVAGAAFALCAWMLRYPAIGLDGLLYHGAEVAAWVDSGRPGAVVNLNYALPWGAYPITTEVLLTWGVGIARSWVVVAPWMLGTLSLLVAAAWLGLRSVGCSRRTSALGTGALAALPLCLIQVNGMYTDLPALAWLVSAGALCAAARRNPALMAPALVAAGMAVGTKTTTVPVAALVVVAALWRLRPALGPHVRVLLAGGALAAVVGGTWYARNLVLHGSPLWPFRGAPWGDPLPPIFDRYGATLLSNPRATLDGRLGEYVTALSGGLLLLAGAALAPLLARTREVGVAAAATAAAVLAWAAAPFTGVSGFGPVDAAVAGSTRYLLPALALATLTLALAGRVRGWPGRVAEGLLAVALLWSLARTATLGFPYLPSFASLLVAAGFGAVIGLLLTGGGWRGPLVRAAPAAIAVGVFLVLAAGVEGYVARHAQTAPGLDAELARWFSARPGFGHDGRAIAMEPVVNAALAGDRLTHRVEIVSTKWSCADIRRRARLGWVVVRVSPLNRKFGAPTPGQACLRNVAPVYRTGSATSSVGEARVYGPPR